MWESEKMKKVEREREGDTDRRCEKRKAGLEQRKGLKGREDIKREQDGDK